MTLVLQIVVALVVLVGLITIIMSVKNWHWAQMLLVLCIFFSSIGVLVLGLEVFRIHRNVRRGIPALEQRIASVEAENQALKNGVRDESLARQALPELPFDYEAEGRMPGMDVWTARLQVLARERGRVWRDIQPASRVDLATGRVQVALPNAQPHGLEKDAILYVFEQGPPTPATPDQGAQYLGEFRAVEVQAGGAILESVHQLDQYTAGRLERAVAKQGARWSLYETMPADRHELFAGLDEQQLRQLLPENSVAEYVRHGSEPTADDDQFERAGFDDKGQRVGPQNADQAVTWRYDRPLRDYAYLFADILRQRAVMFSEIAGLTEDNARLTAALESAKQLTAHRTQERQALGEDLESMQRDRQIVEALLTKLRQYVAHGQQQTLELMQTNARLAADLVEMQLARLRDIQGTAAAPAGAGAFSTTP